jgi:hypothetical protein
MWLLFPLIFCMTKGVQMRKGKVKYCDQFEAGAVGAGAALPYGSFKMIQLLAAPTPAPQHWT